LGHRRIGFLGPELDRYRVASEQHEGARLAVEQLGGPAAVLVHLETADYTESAAKTTFGRAVSGGDYPTALIAASDELARGAWAACQEAEIVIPRDLSLVAWNDTIALNEIPLPLTTVRMDFRQAGESSAQRLLALIEAPESTFPVERIPAQLAIRDSTAPPRMATP
jgi:DNA-binding LacI/PurR family transcriptional regulator